MIAEPGDTNTPDAAADWTPLDALLDGYAPGYDEWNAMRLATGRPFGTFDEYLTDIGHKEN